MLKPKRPFEDSLAINDWIKGKVGPSESPISKRVSNKIPKEAAKPELIEHNENTTTDNTKTIFFLLFASDQAVKK